MEAASDSTLGARDWVALVLVSAFGANTGDFLAHDLHLGHALGLLPLGCVMLLLTHPSSKNTRRRIRKVHLPFAPTRCTASELLGRLMQTGEPSVCAGPLASIFAGILFAESRARFSTEAFCWFAIITMRTAATDLADHDLHIAPLAVVAVLALPLAGLVLTDRTASALLDTAGAPFPSRMPATGRRYWSPACSARRSATMRPTTSGSGSRSAPG